jgi:preprotein translocase subunit SecY
MYLEGLNNQSMGGGAVGDVVNDPGWGFRLLTVLSLTTGTTLIMWLGEQITDRGVGNGISLIIFAGIVANFPSSIARYWQSTGGEVQPLTVAVIGPCFW